METQVTHKKEVPPSRLVRKTNWTPLILVFGLISYCSVCVVVNKNESKGEVASEDVRIQKSAAAFRKFIKDHMNNPKSFEEVETKYHKLDDGTYRICMQYRGTNAFGAVVTNTNCGRVDIAYNVRDVTE